MEVNTILAIFGGLGVGSLLNTLITHFTNQKSKKEERRYEEKKTAYVGLLTSIHDAAISASDENRPPSSEVQHDSILSRHQRHSCHRPALMVNCWQRRQIQTNCRLSCNHTKNYQNKIKLITLLNIQEIISSSSISSIA
ncbi:hypothetical protein PsalN5692_03406 [Piscirickettsia salmonis]|uniref:hypothetical protein n=1 Tax=Piscirickettsia salmonis TaxID=1238 RepID=UPI001E60CADC|nr:hypothetical protein [Piscirickettsia salmonis]QGP51906.1 hypothetical protein PsalN5692_03406 [Piscirickettsia salmonis]